MNPTKLSRLLSTNFKNNNSLNRKTLLLRLLTELLFLNFVDSRRESLVGFQFDSNYDDFWSFFLEATELQIQETVYGRDQRDMPFYLTG